MRKSTKEILILSIGYLPNLGGVETHLKDLSEILIQEKWRVTVLTYQPLHTPVLGKWIERSRNLTIYRLPTIRGLFYKLLGNPFLEFMLLAPLQFFLTPVILFINPNISVINAQGIIGGFSAAIWSKVFNKRYVIATQHVYIFPKTGLYRKVAEWIFKSADKVLAISSQSGKGIEELGVSSEKIQVFTHWENVNDFKPISKKLAKLEVGLDDKFVASFFGRLVKEKGVELLLDCLKKLDPKISLLIYGEGPMGEKVKEVSAKFKNLKYVGTVTPDKLSLHYSAADLVLMPSLHEEGFGRVAAGALLSGTPVIASDRGALPEVVHPSVGMLVKPDANSFSNAINLFFKDRKELENKSKKARVYAVKKFGPKNADVIIKAFEK